MPLPAKDNGPAEHAQGDAKLTDSGEYRYEVAKGDSLIGIAIRFGICLGDIDATNANTLVQHASELQLGQELIVRRSDGAISTDDCLSTESSFPLKER